MFQLHRYKIINNDQHSTMPVLHYKKWLKKTNSKHTVNRSSIFNFIPISQEVIRPIKNANSIVCVTIMTPYLVRMDLNAESFID